MQTREQAKGKVLRGARRNEIPRPRGCRARQARGCAERVRSSRPGHPFLKERTFSARKRLGAGVLFSG